MKTHFDYINLRNQNFGKISNQKKMVNEIALHEAGLNSIWSRILQYDLALITASKEQCIHCVYPQRDKEVNGIYTNDENEYRTKLLRAKLLKHRFGVDKIDGTNIEKLSTSNAKHLDENSFLVINLNNDPNFKDKLIELGKEFCQDAVWIKEKDNDFYLYGTNYASEPGFGNRLPAGGKFLDGIRQMFIAKLKYPPYPFPEQICKQINSKNPNTPLIEAFFESFNVYTDSGQKVKHFSINAMLYISLMSKEDICYK